jgi:hypothetical protein
MDWLIDWNGQKLKDSYYVSFQIIYNDPICDVSTCNYKKLCENFPSKIITKL